MSTAQNEPYDVNDVPTDNGNGGSGGNPSDSIRNIYWIHGLGGHADESWVRAGHHIASTAFKAESFYPGYSQVTLPAAGATLLTKLRGIPVRPEAAPPIAIGHSQGGLAIRAAELYSIESNFEPPPFGGIATFGTPHGGAQIISSVPEILNFLQEGCEIISSAYITELVETSFLLDLFLDADDLEGDLGMPLCEAIFQSGARAAMSGFLAGATEDYQPESTFLDSLNNFPSTLQNVVFYGEETDPVVYRMLFWLNEGAESVDVYTANPDDEYIAKVDSFRLSMEGKSGYYNKMATNYKFWLDRNVYYYTRAPWVGYAKFKQEKGEHRDISKKYKLAAEWIGNLDNMWKRLIGVAGDVVTSTKAFCECYTEDLQGNIDGYFIEEVPLGTDCDRYEDQLTICEYLEEQTFEFMEFDESDGVVSSTSARSFEGAAIGDVMEGSNHQQMRNDKNTQKALEQQLFTGALRTFFYTKPR